MFPCFRKRRTQRSRPISSAVVVLDPDEPETARKESEKEKSEMKTPVSDEKKIEANESPEQNSSVSCSTSALPCMDRLKEELSCAICLEICFEPSTTLCGHSFCMECLRSAIHKCGGKCPKCRQRIRYGRPRAVNTVLWNTIQLLFPQEVEEARKAAGAGSQIPETAFCNNLRNPSAGETNVRRRENVLSRPWEDAAVSAQIPETPPSYNYNSTRHRSARGSVTLNHFSLGRVISLSASRLLL